MIAFLCNEKGADVVERIVTAPGNQCFAHAINLCEVFYDFFRSANEADAISAIADLAAAGIMERDDFDRDFWEKAGKLKATQRRVSLADCFGLTLAVRLGGEFLTTDHHELDSIAALGSYPITFIR